jgi:hypothetical protein
VIVRWSLTIDNILNVEPDFVDFIKETIKSYTDGGNLESVSSTNWYKSFFVWLSQKNLGSDSYSWDCSVLTELLSIENENS